METVNVILQVVLLLFVILLGLWLRALPESLHRRQEQLFQQELTKELEKIRASLAREATLRHDLWKVKYDAYTDALDLVKQRYYSRSLNWAGPNGEHRFDGEPPRPDEYGRIYARLRLLTDDEELVGAFLRALGVEPQEDGSVKNIELKAGKRVDRLVGLMRKDLGARPDPTPKKEFAMIDFNARSEEQQAG